MTRLWEYQNYNAPIEYLFDVHIVEYDISKANISILRDADRISQEEYDYLFQADRSTRQVEIGLKIRRDKSLQEVLNIGLENARRALSDRLNVEDQNVLHIIKDAMFLIFPMGTATPMEIQISDHVRFTVRGIYSNYLRLNRLVHVYHTYNIMTGMIDSFRIRGIGEEMQAKHRDYFTSMIIDILNARQANGFKAAYDVCHKHYMALVNRTCNVECAREFNAQSLFSLKFESQFSSFKADYLSENTITMVDPSYNLELLSAIGNDLLCDCIRRV